MHPFVRLTLGFAAVLATRFVVTLVLKLIAAAAVLAALAFGGLFIVRFVRAFGRRLDARANPPMLRG